LIKEIADIPSLLFSLLLLFFNSLLSYIRVRISLGSCMIGVLSLYDRDGFLHKKMVRATEWISTIYLWKLRLDKLEATLVRHITKGREGPWSFQIGNLGEMVYS
jgi:hypothetical protein